MIFHIWFRFQILHCAFFTFVLNYVFSISLLDTFLLANISNHSIGRATVWLSGNTHSAPKEIMETYGSSKDFILREVFSSPDFVDEQIRPSVVWTVSSKY